MIARALTLASMITAVCLASPAQAGTPEVPLPVVAPAVAAPIPKAVPEAPRKVEAPAPRFDAPVVPREKTRVVVLLYHLFGTMDSPYAITPAAFEEQVQWLADHHVAVISVSDLLRFVDGDLELPEKVAVITIDDGHKSVYTRAFPVLEKHRMPFALALNTGAIEGGRREALTWDQVKAMLASGICEIESHSHIHGHMDRLTLATDRREADLSRSILEARTGVRPEAFVFPFGGTNARVQRVIEEAGYRAAFAAWGSDVTARSPRFALPRVGVGPKTTMAAFARIFEAKAPAPRVARVSSRRRPAKRG